MKFTPLSITDVILCEPTLFHDARGFFFESFNMKLFQEHVGKVEFVQDNHSRSHKGVLRGLHYQLPPKAQGKLVRVTSGSVFDVAVDVRRASATFGQWVGLELSATNHRQLWIPPGFAHGFVVLSEVADFLYKTTDFYEPSLEQCIRWDEAHFAIDWPLLPTEITIASKDAQGVRFHEAKLFNP